MLACLLVAGQLSTATHLLLVRHAVCPLDGELIHPDGAEKHHDPQAHARNEHTPRIAATEAPDGHHGHEHCVLASDRRNRAALHGPIVGLRAPPKVILATLACGSAESAASFARYRLAPKQSPPA